MLHRDFIKVGGAGPAALLIFGAVLAGQETCQFEKQEVVVPDFPAE